MCPVLLNKAVAVVVLLSLEPLLERRAISAQWHTRERRTGKLVEGRPADVAGADGLWYQPAFYGGRVARANEHGATLLARARVCFVVCVVRRDACQTFWFSGWCKPSAHAAGLCCPPSELFCRRVCKRIYPDVVVLGVRRLLQCRVVSRFQYLVHPRAFFRCSGVFRLLVMVTATTKRDSRGRTRFLLISHQVCVQCVGVGRELVVSVMWTKSWRYPDSAGSECNQRLCNCCALVLFHPRQ